MIQDDLVELKRRVVELEYEGDDLAFDRMLGEIDLVIYRLRTACFVPHPPPVDMFMEANSGKEVDWDNVLSDISAGLSTEGNSESEDHSAINGDINF